MVLQVQPGTTSLFNRSDPSYNVEASGVIYGSRALCYLSSLPEGLILLDKYPTGPGLWSALNASSGDPKRPYDVGII